MIEVINAIAFAAMVSLHEPRWRVINSLASALLQSLK